METEVQTKELEKVPTNPDLSDGNKEKTENELPLAKTVKIEEEEPPSSQPSFSSQNLIDSFMEETNGMILEETTIPEAPKSPEVIEEKAQSITPTTSFSLSEDEAKIAAPEPQSIVQAKSLMEMDEANFREFIKTEPEKTESKIIQNEELMTLVAVKGNPKVMRCTRCNTFVSKSSNHSKAECDSRARKFKNNRGKKKGSVKTKKQQSKLLSKVKTMAKKYLTKKSKIPAPLRKLFESLI